MRIDLQRKINILYKFLKQSFDNYFNSAINQMIFVVSVVFMITSIILVFMNVNRSLPLVVISFSVLLLFTTRFQEIGIISIFLIDFGWLLAITGITAIFCSQTDHVLKQITFYIALFIWFLMFRRTRHTSVKTALSYSYLFFSIIVLLFAFFGIVGMSHNGQIDPDSSKIDTPKIHEGLFIRAIKLVLHLIPSQLIGSELNAKINDGFARYIWLEYFALGTFMLFAIGNWVDNYEDRIPQYTASKLMMILGLITILASFILLIMTYFESKERQSVDLSYIATGIIGYVVFHLGFYLSSKNRDFHAGSFEGLFGQEDEYVSKS